MTCQYHKKLSCIENRDKLRAFIKAYMSIDSVSLFDGFISSFS